ncbi:MAG: sugar transferase [Deltaproteobacteria bacterium]|nr:sugar transferase [Deltaproteobacteria bacterium]
MWIETSFYRLCGKRLFDILLSLFSLLALAPIFYLIIAFILVDFRSVPFFVQKRFGRGVQPFRLIKFRSMLPVSRELRREFELGSSARITRIGGILRKTKIDELPALFNVLRGNMSIVGPRPEVAKYVQACPEDFNQILNIRPGLSDFASIKYRDEEAILAGQPDPEAYYLNVILPDKLRLAKLYAKNVSFSTDLRIIIDTIKSIVTKETISNAPD